jgi:glycosyltransferase involved in cell wall biosynthesis
LYTDAAGLFGFFGQFHKIRVTGKCDLMHWTYPIPIRMPNKPNIYTLHDLVPLRLPYTTLDNKRRYFKLVSRIAKKAEHIVTVSESAKQDIIKFLKVPESRITNTYQSVSIPAKYADKSADLVSQEISGTFGLDYKGYYLFWGSIEPKKNLGRIIEGYLASGVTSPLVIVGAQAWKSEEELKLLYDDNIRSLVLNGNETRTKRKVIQLSYAPFPLLVSLIKGAKGTIFPSLYEGFGLPVLESMLLGTPVITSNTASIPEVAGNAAIMVNPYDTMALAKAIRELDADSDLRNHLVGLGRENAKRFSPDIINQNLLQVYEKCF